MKPQDIQITDWIRILLGEVPWSFLVEVAIRIVFLYILVIVSMRLMGTRMAGQVSRNEMAALVSLAATVGIPMQVPDRGLLPALVVAGGIIAVQRLVAKKTFQNKNFEQIALDDIGILVKDGCIQVRAVQQVALSRERVLAQLRSNGIEHLGKVKRLYMESSGSFTIKQQNPPKPGLSILPDWDEQITSRQQKVSDHFTCSNCGNMHAGAKHPSNSCSNCSETEWVPAVVS